MEDHPDNRYATKVVNDGLKGRSYRRYSTFSRLGLSGLERLWGSTVGRRAAIMDFLERYDITQLVPLRKEKCWRPLAG